MKILVVGAGVIGSIFGWALAGSGHEVTHLVRPGRAASLAAGLPIDVLDFRPGHPRRFAGRYALRATETASAADGSELVIVPVKHYQLVATLGEIVPRLGPSEYLLLTQNWVGTAPVDALLPQSRYLYGDARAGGAFKAGTLVCTLTSLELGRADGGRAEGRRADGRRDAGLERAAAVFERAGIKTTLQANILHYLWVQYAINGGLWPALVRAGSFAAVLRDRPTSRLAQQAARECLEVAARRGVDLSQYREAQMYLSSSAVSRWLAGLALAWMFRFSERVRRSSAHALADAREIQVHYDDLLGAGRALGLAMPALASFEPDIRRFCRL